MDAAPLPPAAPVMALPNALLFPHTLLPLHIFEPRYREMLAHALEHHRMFCVALTKPGSADVFPVAGVGLIRVCVENEDGTSNLVLQGLARVRLAEWIQETPFRIARMEEARSENPNPIEAEALGAKVLELCQQLREGGVEIPAALRQEITHIAHPEIVCDKVAGALVENPFHRQAILEEPSVSARLRLLITRLYEKLG